MFRRGGDKRLLATVLFTDIVGSTEKAATLGDRRWRELIGEHHSVLRRSLRQHNGREVDTAGDGFFATFERPADAIACATAAIDGVRRLGIDIRAGVHTGEVERGGSKVGGIAVHIGARVLALAGPGEVIVTSTVRELVGGSGLRFVDRGTHELKGVPEPWHLYALDAPPAPTEVTTAAGGPADSVKVATSTGRRPVLLGLVAGGAVVAVAAVAFLAAGGATPVPSPSAASSATLSPTPSTGPDAAIVLAATGEQVGGQRVGTSPGDVIVGESSIWVANVGSSTVSRIDPDTGVQLTIGGVGRPSGLAYEGGADRLWVLDGLANKLTLVDSRTGAVLESFRQSGRGIGYGAGAIWIADEITESVVVIDPASRQVIDTIALPAGSAPVAVAVADEAVWVAAKGTSSVHRIDPATRRLVGGPTTVIAAPTDIAVAGEDVWVASASGDAAIRLTAADGRVAQTLTDVCDEPGGVAAAPGTAWLTCRRDGTVLRLGPAGVEATVETGFVPNDVALRGDRAWVTLAAE
jgi:class 3 adenylate cyclase/DNA-binding beta-propeller fold protein YncE